MPISNSPFYFITVCKLWCIFVYKINQVTNLQFKFAAVQSVRARECKITHCTYVSSIVSHPGAIFRMCLFMAGLNHIGSPGRHYKQDWPKSTRKCFPKAIMCTVNVFILSKLLTKLTIWQIRLVKSKLLNFFKTYKIVNNEHNSIQQNLYCLQFTHVDMYTYVYLNLT